MDIYKKLIDSLDVFRVELENDLIDTNPEYNLEVMLARVQWFIMCCVALRMMEDRKTGDVSLSDIKELTPPNVSLWQNVLNAIDKAHGIHEIPIFKYRESLFGSISLPDDNNMLAKFIKSLYTLEGWRVDFSTFENDVQKDIYTQYVKYLELRLGKSDPQ